MSRRAEEFYCSTECKKYFKTYLRSNMFGNYTIVCPNCGHHHFRVIKEGLVTEDRHNKDLGDSELIIGLKSTISDTPWHDDPTYRRQSLTAYQGGQNG
jgi:hypothetical protein